MSRMIRCVIFALMGLLAPCLQAAGIFIVNIEYAESPGPQGSYLLVQGEDGLVSLDPISDCGKQPGAKSGEVVAALEKAYPHLEGKITIVKVQAEAGKLASSGKVHVMGQVEQVGEYPAASLEACVKAAKPTPFGAASRIEVIRKQKRYVYDLKKQAETKLEPGDMILVPMKRIIGR